MSANAHPAAPANPVPVQPQDAPLYAPDFRPVLQYELLHCKSRREAFPDCYKNDSIPDTAMIAELNEPAPNNSTAASTSQPDAIPWSKVAGLDLFGLALCGGGIRSGTFNLGILQALASLDLIKRLDYISSVSGGGYIHAWLAAWIRRESAIAHFPMPPQRENNTEIRKQVAAQAIDNVTKQLTPSRRVQAGADRFAVTNGVAFEDEPAPIQHLREYSRFLAPRPGLLTLDTWSLLVSYLRNFLATGLLFVLLAIFVALFLRLVVHAYAAPRLNEYGAWILLSAVSIILIISQYVYRREIADERHRLIGSTPSGSKSNKSQVKYDDRWLNIFSNIGMWCLALAICGYLLCGTTFGNQSRLPEILRFTKQGQFGSLNAVWEYLIYAGCLSFISGFVGICMTCFEKPPKDIKANVFPSNDLSKQSTIIRRLISMLAFGFVFGLLATTIIRNVGVSQETINPVLMATFGPPLLLISMTLAGFLESILLGHLIDELEREFRARVGAMLVTIGLAWMFIFSVLFVGPMLLLQYDQAWWTFAASLTVGGIISAIKVPITFFQDKTRFTKWILGSMIYVGPVLVLAAIGVALSYSLHLLMIAPIEATIFEAEFVSADALMTTLLTGAGIMIAALMYWFAIEPNAFSLHSMYSNRLIRCYLAASRKKPYWTIPFDEQSPEDPTVGIATNVVDDVRTGNEFTGFSFKDDFSLLWLQSDTSSFAAMNKYARFEPWKQQEAPYLGPYPIFNTTINLVSGVDVANQDRKGESFFLTPGYSGCDSTGFAKFTIDEKTSTQARNLTVGRAMTTSGAAVDPNMQNHQSSGLTALLTLLNFRLGTWISNPWKSSIEHPDNAQQKANQNRNDLPKWAAQSPQSAKYLMYEAIAHTRADLDFVHLSDGGHFENTGAYELIRRRCRFIILVDAAEDPLDASENLANLIRLVRTDFGIRIEIDTRPLRKDDKGRSAAHAVAGLIRYDDIDSGAVNGTLLFLRSSLTGDEPADILNYAANTPAFPHHSAADLFFDEAQFESYRMLGLHIGLDALSSAVNSVKATPAGNDPRPFTRRLFAELRQIHAVLPNDLVDSYHQSIDAWVRVESGMRADTKLNRLTQSIYPELDITPPTTLPTGSVGAAAASPTTPAEPVAEIRMMGELLQMMETAWLEMDLDKTYMHPIQRGWMNCFRRYSASEVFREYWPILRPLYTTGFVRFCERVLHVARPVPSIVKWGNGVILDPPTTQSNLISEFTAAWSELPAISTGSLAQDYLKSFFENPTPSSTIWLITKDSVTAGVSTVRSGDVIGVAGVRPFDNSADQLEFLLWIRGAYRSSEIGRTVMPKLIEQIRQDYASHQTVIARYPRLDSGEAASRQRALWTLFFNDFNFQSCDIQDSDIASREIRLIYHK
jgi:hypothetical protein